DDFWGVPTEEQEGEEGDDADDFWGVPTEEQGEADEAAADDFWGVAEETEEEAAPAVVLPQPVDVPPAVFPHWFHRIRLKCASCHPAIFPMAAGTTTITMDALRAGELCANCHNGKDAFEVGFTTCIRCHQAPAEP
ncbi:MAG: hypothetical protein D6696_02465, partial [Acidobacteria bacterium]